MKIETTSPQGEKITVKETPGGVYGSRLRWEFYDSNGNLDKAYEVYLKDFEKMARCFLGDIKIKKK
jgi:LPS sulfotransferase NodH